MKTVLVFGAFDPLHAGHEDFFRQAKTLGDQLIVVVARDGAIKRYKQRAPYHGESDRRQAVVGAAHVDQVYLGDQDSEQYHLLKTLAFDVVALGYDQSPADHAVRQLLDSIGKTHVTIVRLQPFKPDQYKSSFFCPQEKI